MPDFRNVFHFILFKIHIFLFLDLSQLYSHTRMRLECERKYALLQSYAQINNILKLMPAFLLYAVDRNATHFRNLFAHNISRKKKAIRRKTCHKKLSSRRVVFYHIYVHHLRDTTMIPRMPCDSGVSHVTNGAGIE